MLKDKEKALVRALSRVSRHCGILRRFFDRSSDYSNYALLHSAFFRRLDQGVVGAESHCDAVTRADPGPAS